MHLVETSLRLGETKQHKVAGAESFYFHSVKYKVFGIKKEPAALWDAFVASLVNRLVEDVVVIVGSLEYSEPPPIARGRNVR